MVDIFLSYAREDLTKAKQLAAALEKQGWSVFWDRTALLAGQDLDEVIEQAIEQAGCMIVAWSKASKKSDWVRGEANIGRERRILVPILFDSVDPPIAFRSLQTENFATWKGETDSAGYLALCKALTERIGPGTASAFVADKTIQQPTNQRTKKTDIRWPKQLMIKVGKIVFITATPAILLWFLVPVIQAPSPDPKVINQPLIKEPEMVGIPAGSFQMGSNIVYDNKQPVHTVRLKSFAIGRYEVTFDEYDQFAEALDKPKPYDKGWGRGKHPVINVSREDAVAYAQWLSKKTGKQFRLPTETEWEYAARAKTTSDYYWGQEAEDFARLNENSDTKTHPVGQKKPNDFGLYDMYGNVLEWVQDCYEENHDQSPNDGSVWETQNCARRVLRGDPWYNLPEPLRLANRDWQYPALSKYDIGFRLAQD